ncbi:thioredoxin family protein [Bacillus weihaiensis]|uniref:Thioredoxin domain-containing protein n=1 Tax=Bacillus weihaiensis TaxID=1547283 RepID=A0A1L3MN53_9BACI|nr:thioredoxin family protein [Bacillus weihaiensis]APH03775.1 hypothetical protein A9C19_02820 [Bacillus weihaiensis]
MKEWNEKKLLINDKGLMLLYLYTPMCGTCQLAKKMLTVVDELISTTIYQVNLNYFPEDAKALGIESVPCMLVYQDGILKEKVYAFQSVAHLYELVKAYH